MGDPSIPSPLDPALEAALRDPAKRSELNLIQIAEAFQQLQQAKWTDPQIEETYHFTDGQPGQYRRFLRFQDREKGYLRAGHLEFTHAREISRLLEAFPDRVPEIVDQTLKGNLSSRKIKDLVDDIMAAPRPGRDAPGTQQNNAGTQSEGSQSSRDAAGTQQYNAGTQPNLQNNAGTHPGEPRGTRTHDASGVRPHPEFVENDHPLLRHTLGFWACVLLGWSRAAKNTEPVAADDLGAEWWNFTLRQFRKRWLQILSFSLVGAFVLEGMWHVRQDARDWAAKHWMSGGFGLVAHVVGLPAPQVSFAGYAPGHKFHLVWNPVGPGVTYQVLSVCGYEGRRSNGSFLNLDKPVSTPGAIVNLEHMFCASPVALAVRTQSADGQDSALSNIIQVAPDEDNNAATVDPLPEAETAVATGPAAATATLTPASVPSAKPSPSGGRGQGQPQGEPRVRVSPPASTAAPAASLLNANDVTQAAESVMPQTGGFAQRFGNAFASLAGKAVTNGSVPRKAGCSARHIHWWKNPSAEHPRQIEIAWEDANTGDETNLYAARFNQAQSFDRDMTLMKGNAVYWWPPDTGEQIFLLYLTTVDSQGNESAPSERILVDLR